MNADEAAALEQENRRLLAQIDELRGTIGRMKSRMSVIEGVLAAEIAAIERAIAIPHGATYQTVNGTAVARLEYLRDVMEYLK